MKFSSGYLDLWMMLIPGIVDGSTGEEVPIFRVNHIFRAIKVPPCKCILEFSFHPNIGKGYEYTVLVSSGILILLFLDVIIREFVPMRK